MYFALAAEATKRPELRGWGLLGAGCLMLTVGGVTLCFRRGAGEFWEAVSGRAWSDLPPWSWLVSMVILPAVLVVAGVGMVIGGLATI